MSDKPIKEESLDGEHLIVTCNLSTSEDKIPTHSLLDCGATGLSFVDENFASHHHLPLQPLKEPRKLEVIDGRPIASGDITHITKVQLEIDQHVEEIPMFVTKLGHYPIVLGISWLSLHDLVIRFASNTITFDSTHCLHNCLTTPTTVQGVSSSTLEVSLLSLTSTPQPVPALQAALISFTAFQSLLCNKRKHHGKLQVFSQSLYKNQ